jgi:hypothetical protein
MGRESGLLQLLAPLLLTGGKGADLVIHGDVVLNKAIRACPRVLCAHAGSVSLAQGSILWGVFFVPAQAQGSNNLIGPSLADSPVSLNFIHSMKNIRGNYDYLSLSQVLQLRFYPSVFNFLILPICFKNKVVVYPSLLTLLVKIRIID